jgi:hypothetical protein
MKEEPGQPRGDWGVAAAVAKGPAPHMQFDAGREMVSKS